MPAAGSGARLEADCPKALLDLLGVPMFIHAARSFLRLADCADAIVAAPPSWEEHFQSAADREWGRNRVRIITGGAERQDSVRSALASLTSDAEFILVHDAARPLVSSTIISRVLDALAEFEAVVPTIKIADTVKRTDEKLRTVETINRENLVAVQTPQGIRRLIFEEAHRRAQAACFYGTDDVSLVEQFGLGTVKVVVGDPLNFKITTGEDFNLAMQLMKTDAGHAGKNRESR
jgi:2-C-methyl-D-erythritol 4-phosphate cytidylyltransferase